MRKIVILQLIGIIVIKVNKQGWSPTFYYSHFLLELKEKKIAEDRHALIERSPHSIIL